MARRWRTSKEVPKGSLEISRDIYGFTVRPQHAATYKQYAEIYQKEESERATSWDTFFGDYAGPKAAEPTSELTETRDNPEDSEPETAKDTIPEPKKELNRVDSAGSEDCNSDWTTGVRKAWPSSLRQSVWAVEKAIEHRDAKKESLLTKSNESEAVTALNGEGTASLQENECPWFEELHALVRGGVPMSLRGELWQLFAGAKKRKVPGHYQALLLLLADGGGHSDGTGGLVQDASGEVVKQYRKTASGIQERWLNQIEKDLPRTFPGHPVLDGGGRDALRRLLTAYARHKESVGYCQGMNFLAALLLLLMPEEAAFWTLTAIIDDVLDGYYTERMLEAQVDQLVLDSLVRERFPSVAAHFDSLGVQVAWVSGPWFLSCFVNALPWESVLRVWDVVLFENHRCMLFRTALTLIEMHAQKLASVKDAGDAVALLQTLPAGTFDSSQLVLTACMGFSAVTPEALDKLREEHRPVVLAQLAQRDLDLEQFMTKEEKAKSDLLQALTPQESETDHRSHSEGAEALGATGKFKKLLKSMSSVSQTSQLSGGKEGEEEVVDEVADMKAQVDWLKSELSRALEGQQAATARADELEQALLQIADKSRLDDVKKSLQEQVESLALQVEGMQAELASAKKQLQEREEHSQRMAEVVARMDSEQQIAEEARLKLESQCLNLQATKALLETELAETKKLLKEMTQRATMAESMLEAFNAAKGGTGGSSFEEQKKVIESKRASHGEETGATGWLKKMSLSPSIRKPSLDTEHEEGEAKSGSMFSRMKWGAEKGPQEPKSATKIAQTSQENSREGNGVGSPKGSTEATKHRQLEL